MNTDVRSIYSKLPKKENGLASFKAVHDFLGVSIGTIVRGLEGLDTSEGVTLEHLETLVSKGIVSLEGLGEETKSKPVRGLTTGLTLPKNSSVPATNGFQSGGMARAESYETFMSTMAEAYANLDSDTRELLKREAEAGLATGQLRAFMRLASENNAYQETIKQARNLGKEQLDSNSVEATEAIQDISG
jgi:hypothetical protein